MTGHSGPAEINLTPSVSEDGNGWIFSLTASHSWLADAGRVYPVIIDPTIQPGASDFHAYKSNGPTRSDAILVGNADGNSWRTVYKYDYSALAGKQVVGAEALFGYVDGSPSSWAIGLQHATCFDFNCVGVFLGGASLSTGVASIATENLSSKYAEWVRTNQFGAYLMATGVEGGGYSYKELASILYLDWKDFPTFVSIDSPSPANGATNVAVMPTFKVTGTVASGFEQQYRYQVSADSSFLNPVYDSQLLTTQTHQVPAGELDAGQTYYWRAAVADNAHNYLGTSTERWGRSARSPRIIRRRLRVR